MQNTLSGMELFSEKQDKPLNGNHTVLPDPLMAERVGNVENRLRQALAPEEEMEKFPEAMQPVVRALRTLDAKSYRGLINWLRDPSTKAEHVRARLEVTDPTGPLKKLLSELITFFKGDVDQIDRHKDSLLYLSRTELPQFGTNMANPSGDPDKPDDFDAESTTKIIILSLHGREIPVSVESGEDEQGPYTCLTYLSKTKLLRPGETAVLGRGPFYMREALGMPLLGARERPNDLHIGDSDMSRACIRVTREGKRLRVEECGAMNAWKLRVEKLAEDGSIKNHTCILKMQNGGFGYTEIL